MTFLPKFIHDRLLANGRRQDPVRGTDDEIDFHPVVKLFTPDENDNTVNIQPLFVSLTPDMVLTDHDGVAA